MTHPASPARPRIRAVGDHALLVEFGETLTAEGHEAALRLDAELAEAPFPGFCEAVPANVSVLIDFDPMVADAAAAESAVERVLADAKPVFHPSAAREALICYDEDLGPDLQKVAAQTGLSVDDVIAQHLCGDYSVYMYGFAPGYAYLSGVPERLRIPRKSAPLRGVSAGSVIIAGSQCLITTLTMPTGWWIIGRSPTRILTGDERRPFLFDVADRVKFRRIERAEFNASTGQETWRG